jgi:hypothetical protein
MTYFKDKDSSKPQGTIPLKECSIDLPNDGRKSFLLRGRGRDVDGYEMRFTHSLSLSLSLVTRHLIRITHASRRPFLLVFLTGEKRADWVRFLTQYIAVSFLSPAYLLAEKLKPVDGLTLPFRLSLSLHRWNLCGEEDVPSDRTTN